MSTIWMDVRYAWRQLRRSPAFTVTAILTLGLGLAATATMYNVIHDVLTAPLPYAAPQQLVGVAFTYPTDKPNDEQNGASGDFLKQHARSFDALGLAEDSNTGVNLSFSQGSVLPAQVHARRASRAYLTTFGVAPMLGHIFDESEDVPNGPHVVMLSYALWRNSFHSDPSIVGRSVELNEEPHTVVGVMPQDFRDPSTVEASQLWLPLQLSPKDAGYDGDNYMLIGRLRIGVSAAAAQAELAALNEPFLQQFPYYRRDLNDARQPHSYRVWPLAQVLTSNVRTSLLAMGSAVLAVLLMACLNVAGLMTTRGAERAKELAIRRALGASHRRMLNNLLAEGLLLAVCSSILAIVFARLVTPPLMAASPLMLPALGSSHLWQTTLFVLLVSFGASAFFSLLPAIYAVSQPAASTLPGRGGTGVNRSQASFGKVLVVIQVALAMVLLCGASLLLGTFLKLQSTSPGFVPDHVMTAQVTMKGSAYDTTLHKTQFINKVTSSLERMPGVKHVAAIDGLPLDRGLNLGMFPVGHPDRTRGATELRPVTADYFRTLDLSLLAGRTFNEIDNAHAPLVAVISETAARQWWPGISPVGQSVSTTGKDAIVMHVVGVVSDTHTNSLAEPNAIMIYMPYQQMEDDLTKIVNQWISTSFVMRTGSNVPMANAIQQAVREADPSMPVANIATMQAVINKTTAAPRFMSWLATSFAGFALLLTVLGLFGLLSYQVTQRTREMGLRLALGATRANLLRSIMQRGLFLTSLGLAIGVVVSMAMPRLVGGILGDVIHTGGAPLSSVLSGNGMPLVISMLMLFVSAMFASYLPARRAANVEPMEALRAE